MAEKRLDLIIDPTKAEQGGKRVKKVLVDLQKDAKVLVKSFKDANAAIGNSKKVLDTVVRLEKQLKKLEGAANGTGDAFENNTDQMSAYDKALKKAEQSIKKNYDQLQLLGTETGKHLILTQNMIKEKKASITAVTAEAKAIDNLNKELEESQGKLSALQKGYGKNNAEVVQSLKLTNDLASAQAKLQLVQTQEYKTLQKVNSEVKKYEQEIRDSLKPVEKAATTQELYRKAVVDAQKKARDEIRKTNAQIQLLSTELGKNNVQVKANAKLKRDLAEAQAQVKLRSTAEWKELQKVNEQLKRMDGTTTETKKKTDELTSSFGRSTNSTRKFERSLMGVGIAASMISGTEMLGQLVQTLDKYTEFQNKIAVVTGSTDNLAETTRELLEVSLATRTSLEATTDLYSKLTRVNERFGMSQREVLDITTTVSQAVAMSGASSAAAEGAVIQFAQALAGDFKTAGQELNSILEQTPGLAQTIASGLTKLGTQGEVTASQLKKLASEGLLSTEQVLQGLQAASVETANAFKKSSKTISQAQEGLTQAFIVTAGEIDKTVGVSESLVSSLEDMTEIISTNKEAVAALAGAFTGLAGTAILGTTVALLGLISAPWLAAATGITAVASALSVTAFRSAEIEQATKEASEGVVTLTEKLEELRKTSSKDITPFQFVNMSFGVEQEINDLKSRIEEVKKLRQNYAGQVVSGYTNVSQTKEQSEEVKNLSNQLSSLRSQLELLEKKRGVLDELFVGGLGSKDQKSPLGLLEESLENLITKKDPLEKTKKEIEEINEQIDRYKKLLKEAGKDPLIDPVAVELLQKLEQIKLDKMAAALSKSKVNLVDWDKTLREVAKDLQGQVETFGMTERAMALHTNAKQAEIKVEEAYEKQLEKGLITRKEVDDKVDQAVNQTVEYTNRLHDLKDALKEANKEASNIADISNLFNKAGDSVTKFTLTSKELDVFKDKALDMLDGTKVGLERYQETIERLNSIEVKNPLDNLLFDINASALEKQLKPLEDTLDVLRSKLAMEDISDDSKKNIREAMQSVETEIGKVKFDHIANSFEAGLSGLQRMSSEGSTAFQALGAAIDVVNGIQAINAVLTQGSGDPYTAFARMATMAGIVASMGYSVGGALSGGSDGSARAQEVQGTGTVLGDTAVKSESILKASEITAEATSELVGINRSMLDALNNLQAGISGAVTMIARGSSGISLPTGQHHNVFRSAFEKIPGAAIVDDLFGGGISKLASKLIGGKVKSKDSGIRIIGGALDDLMDNTITEAFSKWRQRSSFFSSYKNKEATEALDDSVNRQFSLVFEGINDSVKSGAEVLKISSDEIQSALNTFVVETTDISLKGLDPEEQQAELQAVFSTIFDDLAEDVVPFIDDFQRAGEALGETLARVASNVTLTEHSVNKLNIGLPASSEALSHFSTSLIDASGGFEGFSSNVSDFVSGFKTESEQLTIQTEDLINAFEDVGRELPSTRQGFVSLIESLTDPNDIANVLALSEATDDFFDSMESLEEGFRSGFFSITENLEKAVEDSARELERFSDIGVGTQTSLSALRFEIERYVQSEAFTPEGYARLLSAADALSAYYDASENLEDHTLELAGSFRDASEILISSLENLNQLTQEQFTQETSPEDLLLSIEKEFSNTINFIGGLTGTAQQMRQAFNKATNEMHHANIEGFSLVDNVDGLTGTAADIAEIYENVLGRAPDWQGLTYWVGQVKFFGQSLNEVYSAFEQSDEAQRLNRFEDLLSAFNSYEDFVANLPVDIENVPDALQDVFEPIIDSIEDIDTSGLEALLNDLRGISDVDVAVSNLGIATEGIKAILTAVSSEGVTVDSLLSFANSLGLSVDVFIDSITTIKDFSDEASSEVAANLERAGSIVNTITKVFEPNVYQANQLSDALNLLGVSFEESEQYLKGLTDSNIVSIAKDMNVSVSDIDEAISTVSQGINDSKDALLEDQDKLRVFGNDIRSVLDNIKKGLDPEQYAADQLNESLNVLGVTLNEAKGYLDDLNFVDLLLLSRTLGLSMNEVNGHINTVIQGLRDSGDSLVDVVESVEEVSQSLEDMISNISSVGTDALAGLKRSVNDEKEDLEESLETLLGDYNNQINNVNESISELQDLSRSLGNTLRNTRIESDALDRVRRQSARDQLRQALVAARAGNLPTSSSISSILDVLSKPSEQMFTSFADYARSQASVSSDIIELNELTGDQLSVEESTLMNLEMLVDTTQRSHDEEIQRLDDLVEDYERQIDVLMGVDSSVKSVETAVSAVEAAIHQMRFISESSNNVTSVTSDSKGNVTVTAGPPSVGGGDSRPSGGTSEMTLPQLFSLSGKTAEQVELFSETPQHVQQIIVDVLKRQGQIQGFRTGTEVPRDNFLMNAHEGERLLSAQENRIYSGMMESSANETALLRQEVSQMRREMNTMLTSINQHSSSTANNTNTLRRWERNPGSQTVTTA